MPPKRQFGKYLWDSSVEVPPRSKYRFKKRSFGAGSAPVAMSEENSSDGSDTEADDARCLAHAGSNQSTEPRCVEHCPSQSCDPSLSPCEDSSSSDSESEPDADLEPDHSERQCMEGWKDELDEDLFPGSKVTRAESLLMVMAHSLRHGTSKEATESLLQLLSAHLPEGVAYPTSKYTFFRHFSGAGKQYVKHFYCSGCSAYIGELVEAENVTCTQCSLAHTGESLRKSSSFFIVMDLKSQIREVLESNNLQKTKKAASFDVSDITQSYQYHKLPLGPNDVTLTFNTDGVPLFENSNSSMWPLLAMVNELSFKHRIENLLLAGLWFGPGKPAMNCFLIPFITAMNELSSTGILWNDKDGVQQTSKVFPGPCAVDSVARCELMNMTQFNGAHGCAWCEDQGQVVPKGKGYCRVYPPSASAPKLRTHESFLQHAGKAKESPSCGIKGASVLTQLAFFRFGTGFVVDYMHAVCLGFVRATLFLWLKSERCRKFHFRRNLEDANSCLLSLTPTWELSRLPRSLCDAKDWKAAEWRNWLLYYSAIVLKGRLPDKQYKHWMRFVEIMHHLLGPCIPVEQLLTIKKEMTHFLFEYEELYGTECMSYNAHLLSHLVDSVINWGPLWAYSLYPFESMNGTLGRLVCGTRYPQFQIADKFCILQAQSKLWSSRHIEKVHRTLETSFRSLAKGYSLRKNVVRVGSVLLLGKGDQKADRKEFHKMVIGPFRFCTARLDKSKRRNSYVHANGVFGRIVQIFFKDSSSSVHGSQEVEVCMEILNVKQKLLNNLPENKLLQFVEVFPTMQSCVVKARCLEKCIFLNDKRSVFLCSLHDNMVLESV